MREKIFKKLLQYLVDTEIICGQYVDGRLSVLHIPSEKYDDLSKFCDENGLILCTKRTTFHTGFNPNSQIFPQLYWGQQYHYIQEKSK